MKGVLRKFPGGFKNVKGQIQRRLRNVSRETFQRCFKEVSGVFQSVSIILHDCFKEVSRKLQEKCVFMVDWKVFLGCRPANNSWLSGIPIGFSKKILQKKIRFKEFPI